MPWAKGQSGNPAGAKRSSSLARLARNKTVDGLTLVEFAVGVLTGTVMEKSVRLVKDENGDRVSVTVELPPSLEDRMEAMKWLADRGWGKAVETVEIDDKREPEPIAVAPVEQLEAMAGSPTGTVQ